jgi:cbb3-type cytochrome oxidase subunit 3
MVGLLSGGLALLAIALIAVIAVAFSRRARSSDEGRS